MYLDDYVELACRVSQNRECKHIALHYSLKNVEPAEGDYELDDFAKDAIYATICTMYEQSIHDYSCYEIYYEIIIRPETGRANDISVFICTPLLSPMDGKTLEALAVELANDISADYLGARYSDWPDISSDLNRFAGLPA